MEKNKMEEVVLCIGEEVFKAKKDLLCEYSDYFRAMFSGSYVESEKQKINIDMLDPRTMKIILNYMEMGMILLSEYPLSTIGQIAVAANFLQITELIKQIEYVLNIQLSNSNWMQTMGIAQDACFSQLEQFSAAYGLYSFQSMNPEDIPTIHKLVWYLSHPYLDAQTELAVFKFGLEWILNYDKLDDVIIILACLDMLRVINTDLVCIQETLSNYDKTSNCLAQEVVACLYEITSKGLEISESNLCEQKTELCKKFGDNIWSKSMILVKNSNARCLKYTPVLPLSFFKPGSVEHPDLLQHCLYTYEENKGFKSYLEVAEKNLWGWNVASWGLTKLVIVCGEHGRGTGIWMRDVKVYDILKKEWTHHGVQLPPRRHAGITVMGDCLYIVGGVGEFRVVQESVIQYDLKQRSFVKIAKLPDAVQSPGVCSHENKIYATGERTIYFYDPSCEYSFWDISAPTEMRMSHLASFNNYIYCVQRYFRNFYRFRPGIDKALETITTFSNPPSAMCNLGNRLTVFTRTESYLITVEEYKGQNGDEKPKLLSSITKNAYINDVAGSCTSVMTMPPLCTELSDYLNQYLH